MREKTNGEFSAEMKERIYRLIKNVLDFVADVEWNKSFPGNAKEQLVNAITSIGANYVEAIGGSSTREFSRFIGHSLRSANESQFWLRIINDSAKINSTKAACLIEETAQIARILASTVKTLRNQNFQTKNSIFEKPNLSKTIN